MNLYMKTIQFAYKSTANIIRVNPKIDYTLKITNIR